MFAWGRGAAITDLCVGGEIQPFNMDSISTINRACICINTQPTNQPTSISLFSFKPFQIIGIVILFEEARYRAGECGRGKEERGREGATKPLSVQEGEDGGKKEQEEKEEFYTSLSP